MRVVEINEQTRLPLSLVAGFVCTLAGGIFWLTMLYADVAQAKRDIDGLRSEIKVLHDINARLARIEGKLDIETKPGKDQ